MDPSSGFPAGGSAHLPPGNGEHAPGQWEGVGPVMEQQGAVGQIGDLPQDPLQPPAAGGGGPPPGGGAAPRPAPPPLPEPQVPRGARRAVPPPRQDAVPERYRSSTASA